MLILIWATRPECKQLIIHLYASLQMYIYLFPPHDMNIINILHYHIH